MTKGIYIHTSSQEEYELLDDKVINKDNESRMVLYCKKGNPRDWFVRSIKDFQRKFTLKRG